jgi:hypothetical protein
MMAHAHRGPSAPARYRAGRGARRVLELEIRRGQSGWSDFRNRKVPAIERPVFLTPLLLVCYHHTGYSLV